MIRSSIAAAVALATALLASATAFAQQAPFDINVILPLTGPLAFIGTEEQSALGLAQDVINKSGGIRGRSVRFVIADDTSSPQIGVQLMSGLVAKNVPVVLGPNISAGCSAVIPIIEKGGPLTFCLSPLLQPAAESYAFAVGVSPKDFEAVMTRYARARGWTRVGIITSIDSTGQVMEKELDTILQSPEERGLRIVAREHYSSSDISVAAQVARVKAQDPQVIFSFAAGPAFATLLHGLRDGGLDVPVIGAAGNMVRAQLDSYAAFLPKDVYFFTVGGIVPDPFAAAKVKAAQRVYFDAYRNAKLFPGQAPTVAWDAAMVVVDALRALGPAATPQQLRDHLEGLRDFGGVAGLYDYRRYVHRGLGPDNTVIYRWDQPKHDFAVVPMPKGR